MNRLWFEFWRVALLATVLVSVISGLNGDRVIQSVYFVGTLVCVLGIRSEQDRVR